MSWDNIDNLKWGDNIDQEDEVAPIVAKTTEKTAKRRTTACVTHSERYLYRRAYSESSLLDAMGIEQLRQGDCWHFITAGDVDSLSYLKVMLRHQNIKHLIVSTWCMAAEDILQFDEWIEQGKIKKIDFYVGEIFPSSYRIEYGMLNELIEKHKCGRIAVFRNHSKVYAGDGEKFKFAIETSANINTNPRTEQGVMTINDDIYHFYKEYFDKIKSFEQ